MSILFSFSFFVVIFPCVISNYVIFVKDIHVMSIFAGFMLSSNFSLFYFDILLRLFHFLIFVYFPLYRIIFHFILLIFRILFQYMYVIISHDSMTFQWYYVLCCFFLYSHVISSLFRFMLFIVNFQYVMYSISIFVVFYICPSVIFMLLLFMLLFVKI